MSHPISASPQPPMEKRSLWESLKPFFLKRKLAIVRVFAISLSAGLVALVFPMALKSLTNDIRVWTESGTSQIPLTLWLTVGVMFGSRVIVGVLEGLQAAWQMDLGFSIISELQLTLFQRLHRAPMAFFTNARQGDILYRLTNDVESILKINNDALPKLSQDTVTALLSFVAMWAIHPTTAVVALIISVVFIFPSLMANNKLSKRIKADNSYLERIYAHLQESVETPRLIRTFGLQQNEVESQEKELYLWNARALKTALVRKLFRQMPKWGIILMPGGVFLFAGRSVLNGELSLGSLMALVAFTPTIIAPFKNIADNAGIYQAAMPSLHRVCEFLHLPEEQKQNLPEFPTLKGHIVLEKVHFTYPGTTREVLKGISLSIRPGEHVGLVGTSGGGKSTIIQLLMGLYPSTSGIVTVDGHDPHAFELSTLRRQVGFVAQDTFLLNSTLKENLKYASPAADDLALQHALQTARLTSWVESLPQGLDTIVGERGLKLSGGQRQRLAVARAVLRNPPLLILDEATSSLDGETEAELQEELELLMPGRTVITIAHRLATVRHCDRILVLADGFVAEQGTFEQLLEKGGIFKSLYEAQFQNKSGLNKEEVEYELA